MLTASSGLLPGAPSDEELTLGDAWLEVFQQVLPSSQCCAAGKLVARAYRDQFGEEPPRRQQFVDGAPRQVKSYRRSWLIDTRQRVWVTTAEACSALGMSRETLRQLRLHPGSRPPAVAPGKRGGHHHGLEPAAPAGVSGRAVLASLRMLQLLR